MQNQGTPMADVRSDGQRDEPLIDRLYRNDLKTGADDTPILRFTEVTQASGIHGDGYGMGVATGDFDNDGWVDLYVTNFGPNVLLRNRGDGTFEDVTASSGTGDRNWTIGATFFDFDRDGWLDLFSGNYLEFSLASHVPCPMPSGALTYCGPGAYMPQPDTLFRNLGNGTFQDVSISSGIRSKFGAGMGVVAADFNGDAWIDFFVTNDGMPNQLWINRRDGTFLDDALFAGVSVNQDGQPEASMGVDAADFDGDGDEDLYVTHLGGETNTLYVSGRPGMFSDRTIASGMTSVTVRSTGFGAGWLDYDNDGSLDLFVANGAVYTIAKKAASGDPYPFHERNLLLRNTGDGRWKNVSVEGGPALELSEVSRGAAFGDLDNDGDTDVLVTNNSGPARLLLNEVGNRRHWLGLSVVEGDPPRAALGARVALTPAGGTPLRRRVRRDGSYCSAHDPRLLFGLGDASSASRVEVRWPDGTIETWSELPADRWHTLRRGTGNREKSP